MTKEYLLKASIAEFEDHKNNALLWDCDRIFTSSGYCYILKKSSKPVSCAIHYNRTFETDENIGKYENNDVAINTREELGFQGVIEYKGMHFAFNSQGNWNETMAQYHYSGSGGFGPIQNTFLVTDIAEVEKKIGADSMPIFMDLEFGVPIVPAYYQADSMKRYVMVHTEYVGDLTPVRPDLKSYVQHKRDTIKLAFVNFTTHDAMHFLNRLQELSLSPKSNFGFLTIPGLKSKDTYQISFNWKALVYESEFDINYCLKGDYNTEKTLVRIREAFFKAIASI